MHAPSSAVHWISCLKVDECEICGSLGPFSVSASVHFYLQGVVALLSKVVDAIS